MPSVYVIILKSSPLILFILNLPNIDKEYPGKLTVLRRLGFQQAMKKTQGYDRYCETQTRLLLGKLGRADDGVFLFQGDIAVAQSDVSRITELGNTGRKKRALMRDRTRLWQSPIYYEISPRLSRKWSHAISNWSQLIFS